MKKSLFLLLLMCFIFGDVGRAFGVNKVVVPRRASAGQVITASGYNENLDTLASKFNAVVDTLNGNVPRGTNAKAVIDTVQVLRVRADSVHAVNALKTTRVRGDSAIIPILTGNVITRGTHSTDSAFSTKSFTAPRIRGTNNIIGGTVSGTTGLFTGALSVDSLNSTKQIVEAGTVLSGKYLQGNGTAGIVPRYTAARTLADGVIRDDGTNVGVGGNATSSIRLTLVGNGGDENPCVTKIGTRGFLGSVIGAVYAGHNVYFDGTWKTNNVGNGSGLYQTTDNGHYWYHRAAGATGTAYGTTLMTLTSVGLGVKADPVSGVALTVGGKTVSDTIQAVRARVDSAYSAGAVKAVRGRFDSLSVGTGGWFRVDTGSYACTLFSNATGTPLGYRASGIAKYTKIGDVVTISFPELIGTTITGPAGVRILGSLLPTNDTYIAVPVVKGTPTVSGNLIISISLSIGLLLDAAGDGLSGTCGLRATSITYKLKN
jgi:hypothetical protein